VATQVEPEVTLVQPVRTIFEAVPMTVKPSEFEVIESPVALKVPVPAVDPVKVTLATPLVKVVVPA
jgi:hypothetical protein